MWEIEAIASELAPYPTVLASSLVVISTARASSTSTAEARMSACSPLDHVFAHRNTESTVTSWRVVPEPNEALGLSDHAPIEDSCVSMMSCVIGVHIRSPEPGHED